METKAYFEGESSRMETFRLLSECYRLPKTDIAEKTADLERCMADACESAVVYVRGMREALGSSSDIGPLKVDYAKLFVGPYTLSAAPYGSVYLDGERKIMGVSTLDVMRRYREAGLERAESFKDAPDHVSAELEFMYYLVFKEMQALSDSEVQTAIGFIQKQKEFLDDHLTAWLPTFAGCIKEHAQNPFYPNLAKATEAFLENSRQLICAFLESISLGPPKALHGSFESIAGLVTKYQTIDTR